MFMIRRLASEADEEEDDLKFELYWDLDINLIPDTLRHIIGQTENIGAIIRMVCCDQHPKNRTMYNRMGVTVREPYIMSPTYPNRKIYMGHDWIHIMKNFCFALMDRIAMIRSSSGEYYPVGKHDFEELLPLISSEVSPGFR